MLEKDKWRLTGMEDFLNNECFKYQNFADEYEDTEHEHCIFCGAKFSSNKEDLQWGYSSTTRNGYWWVCPECFNALKDVKGWTVSE